MHPEKLLEVPKYYQGSDRYCHLTCLLMVLRYLGDEITEKQLKDDLEPWYQDVVHSEGVAVYAAQQGFDVTFYVRDLGVIAENIEELSKEDIDKRLETATQDYQAQKLKLYQDCLDAGVDLKNVVPAISKIKKKLDEDTPVIASVKAAVLYGKERTPNHSVVIVGYDNKNFWVNDPGAKQEAIEDPYPVSTHDFIYGWYQVSGRTFIVSKQW